MGVNFHLPRLKGLNSSLYGYLPRPHAVLRGVYEGGTVIIKEGIC